MMGTGIEYKCPKCSFQKSFHLGSGFGYPSVYQEVIDKIRKGAYGKEWKMFFEEHPGAVVNAEIELYRCPACNHLEEDYNLSLYEHKEGRPPEYGYWISWGDEKQNYRYIKSYKHHCPKCGKRMKKITEDTAPIPCPKCGEILEQDPWLVKWD